MGTKKRGDGGDALEPRKDKHTGSSAEVGEYTPRRRECFRHTLPLLSWAGWPGQLFTPPLSLSLPLSFPLIPPVSTPVPSLAKENEPRRRSIDALSAIFVLQPLPLYPLLCTHSLFRRTPPAPCSTFHPALPGFATHTKHP